MKPKYTLFSNAKYAFEGLLTMVRNEISFRIELCIILPLLIISIFLPISLFEHLFLVAVLFLILILECVNSAIEACVDLVTNDFAPLAKIAKDCASAGVFLSVVLAILSWFFVLLDLFDKNKLWKLF
ncbi:diacylglycerol kinase [Helicobacter didelphidarum]|uniref:Diacylglycerol kinase n=1 Tax=Helicobacter didelphidarum TaxID=2040648 RepID=A0A3D8IQS9_9HELI|nr:diacylglycerol kinase [Helicobacter didelphidarum]RDU67619.1 diacylglycerol kinase [Helicobacter didelphidarum]